MRADRFTRARRPEDGTSAVEFAIVLTVLLLILFGTVQFGIAYNRAQGLEAASREGARLASIGSTADEIANRVRTSQSLFVGTDVVVVTIPAATGSQRPCAIAGVGNLVEVDVTVPASPKYAIEIPLWGKQNITYSAKGTFRCERGIP